MDFNEYGSKAIRTAPKEEMDQEHRLLNGVLGINGEAGEIADAIKKWQFQGHNLNVEDLAKEVGDCLWYLNLIADCLGYSLEEVAKMNIKKLEKRYPTGKFRSEDSINREENTNE